MGRMSELDIALREIAAGLSPLDFDNVAPSISDDRDWWKQQDAEMERDELDALEYQAEIEDMRLNGYA